MTTIDLDAKKRARAEQNREGHTLVWNGKTYELPPEAPFAFAEFLATGDYRNALSELMDGKAEEFFDGIPKPSLKDVETLVNELADVYTGETPGESEASSS